jgi:hypothetical protein
MPAFAGMTVAEDAHTPHVIASEAKQSISPRKERVDCFVASAPRDDGGGGKADPLKRDGIKFDSLNF